MAKAHIQQFHQYVQLLLEPYEREKLHGVLADFAKSRSVPKLVDQLKEILSTPVKKNLLRYIRPLIPVKKELRAAFDRLAPYSEMDRPMSNEELGLNQKKDIAMLPEATILIRRVPNASFGFTVRGGHEIGTGIYVSEVKPDSPSGLSGLAVGDRIINCNGVDFAAMTLSRAKEIISSASTALKLIVVHEGRIPNTIEKSDVNAPTLQAKTKLVRLSLDNGPLGFSIRGGSEHNVPIFVSGVDKGGQAERAGLVLGDRIEVINDAELHHASHADVVKMFKSSREFKLIVRGQSHLPQPRLIRQNVDFVSDPNPKDPPRAPSGESNKRDMETAKLHRTARQIFLKALRQNFSPDESSRLSTLVDSYEKGLITITNLMDALENVLIDEKKQRVYLDIRPLLRSQDLVAFEQRYQQAKQNLDKDQEVESTPVPVVCSSPSTARRSPKHVSIEVSNYPQKPLGLTISGGAETAVPQQGVYIRNIQSHSIASTVPELQPGLQIFAINGTAVGGMTHSEVMDFFKTVLQAEVRTLSLTIGRQPLELLSQDTDISLQLSPMQPQLVSSTAF